MGVGSFLVAVPLPPQLDNCSYATDDWDVKLTLIQELVLWFVIIEDGESAFAPTLAS